MDKRRHGNSGLGKTGRFYEDAVIDGLERRGFRLITRNYYVHRKGEIDAVMEYRGHVYLIEVKARRSGSLISDPIEAVTPHKVQCMKRCIPYLIDEFGLAGMNIHFLAGCVSLNADGSIQNVQIIPFA